MKLRKYIRQVLNEEAHTFHGYKFGPGKIGLRGPKFSDKDNVAPEDIEAAIEWLEDEEPDELVAFSRGAAVLNQMLSDEPGIADEVPPVTYISPAALRKWTSAPVPVLPAGSKVVHSDGDNIVPLRQACQVASDAGVSLNVVKGKGDGVDHVRALSFLKKGADYEIDSKTCLASDMPDWGESGEATEKELDAQMKLARELGGIEEHLRRFVRDVLNETVEFREVDSPLTYHRAGNIKRLALCDSSVTEGPRRHDTYFAEIERWRRRTKSGRRRLKKPVLDEVIPGVSDNCIIGFLDYHSMGQTSEGKPMYYIDYMKTRRDFGGQKVASRLIDEFFSRYASEPGSYVTFGKMMRKEIGHLKNKMAEKYPENTVVGGVNY